MARRHYFSVIDKRLGGTYRVDILDNNYSGSDTEILCFAPSPLQIKQRSFDTDGRVFAFSRKLTFTLYIENSTQETEYDYLFKSFYKDVEVWVYYNSSLRYKFYVKPQESIKDYIEYPKQMTVTASDGIEELKDIQVVEDESNDFTEFEDIKPIEVISEVLKSNGLLHDIIVCNGTFENTYMASTEQLLEQAEVLTPRYQRQVRGEVGWVTGFEALETTLLPFNCYLKQSGGVWYIINNTFSVGRGHVYDSDGVYVSEGGIDITKDITDICATSNGTIRYDAPLNELRLTTRNSSFFGAANPNPYFTSAGASWTASADWTQSTFTNNRATLIETVGYVGANSYDLTSDQFLVAANGDITYNFFIRHRLQFLSAPANSVPYFEVQYNVNGGTFVQVGSSVLLKELALQEWNDLRINVDSNQPADFQMQIRIRFYDLGPGSNVWDELEHWIDQFYMVPTYSESTAFDVVRTTKIVDSTSTRKEEFEQFFSGDVPLNTIAGMLIKGNDGPFTFSRQGKTESLDLGAVLSVDSINYYGRFMEIVDVDIIYDQIIDTHHVINHNGKLWHILAYSLDPFNGILNLQLREMWTDPDVNYVTSEITLNSIDGYDYEF